MTSKKDEDAVVNFVPVGLCINCYGNIEVFLVSNYCGRACASAEE